MVYRHVHGSDRRPPLTFLTSTTTLIIGIGKQKYISTHATKEPQTCGLKLDNMAEHPTAQERIDRKRRADRRAQETAQREEEEDGAYDEETEKKANDDVFHNYTPPRRLLFFELITVILLMILLLFPPHGFSAISMKGTDTVGLLRRFSSLPSSTELMNRQLFGRHMYIMARRSSRW